MTATNTYKHLIAAILLMLYAFVSIPVGLWHHHIISENTPTTTANSGRHEIVSKASDSNTESSCQICSHKFSSYNNDAPAPVESSPAPVAAKNGYYCLSVISIPTFSLSNKGPPALS